MSLTVKQIQTTQDRKLAYQVRIDVFVTEQKIDRSLELDEFEEESIHLLALDGCKPIGAGRVRLVNDYAKVERICVLMEYRGKGIGELIMDEADQIAREWKLTKLFLNAQVQAQHFYERCGYTRADDKVFDEAGIPHIAMIKKLL